ncbi:hypothetical protein MNBD_NITROSPINAE04-688 [hydrothermal vent metagenome]|uniref:HicB-like antitoxin of toxin-antitoxin system domain-containing protein n=1 Tax=hydrothermal vent metagenome TaxID=652676 RepID=A0A3B1CFL9_9ZZZZ
MRVEFIIRLPFKISKEGRYYVSCCPVLDVGSQATTKKKAKENLIEAVGLFLVSCFERGTLDQVLKDCGFKPLHTIKKPTKRALGRDEIEAPFPFQISKASLSHCPA